MVETIIGLYQGISINLQELQLSITKAQNNQTEVSGQEQHQDIGEVTFDTNKRLHEVDKAYSYFDMFHS